MIENVQVQYITSKSKNQSVMTLGNLKQKIDIKDEEKEKHMSGR